MTCVKRNQCRLDVFGGMQVEEKITGLINVNFWRTCALVHNKDSPLYTVLRMNGSILDGSVSSFTGKFIDYDHRLLQNRGLFQLSLSLIVINSTGLFTSTLTSNTPSIR